MPRSPLRHFRLVLMAAGALLFGHAAAAQEHPGTEGRRPDRPPRLRAGVGVLDTPTLEALTHSPEGRTSLVFGSITPSLRRLSKGDVLVGGASARAPQGLVRRVTRAVRRDGGLAVETEPATLEDLFWRARAGARIEMTAADIAAAAAQVEGVLVPEATAQAWSPGRLEFELLDVVLLDLDANPTTTGDANRQWSSFVDLPDGPDDIDVQWLPPELTAEAAATVYAGPQLTVLLYDLGGPFASVYGYTTLHAEVLPSRN